MEMSEETRGDVLILTPVGRLDTNTSDAFHEGLTKRLQEGSKRIVIDMSGIPYVSSAGLRVFLLTAKKLSANRGKLVLSGLNPSVSQVCQLAGFMEIFVVESDLERGLLRATA